jgi:hypothetical protein
MGQPVGADVDELGRSEALLELLGGSAKQLRRPGADDDPGWCIQRRKLADS